MVALPQLQAPQKSRHPATDIPTITFDFIAIFPFYCIFLPYAQISHH